MTIKDRGLMKWAPAAFMTEQVGLLRELHTDLLREAKPQLDDCQIEEFEARIHFAMEYALYVSVDVWCDGFVSPIVGRVCRLDAINKVIHVEDEAGVIAKVDWNAVVGVAVLDD